MAKARSIAGIGKDDPYASVAARVVATRARELAEHADGVLDTADIERLHDMRVATRRLRAALEVFESCFPRKRFRVALREVKALADALGERRDRDVTLAALERFEAGVGAADRPGVRRLAKSLREEQREANSELAPSVTPERIAALERRLGELAATAADLIDQRSGEAPPQITTDPPVPAPPAEARINGGGPR
jgi:CHAD domain-containing protein